MITPLLIRSQIGLSIPKLQLCRIENLSRYGRMWPEGRDEMAMHRYVLLRQRRTLTKTITRDTRLNSTTGTRDSGRNSDLNKNTNCLGETVYPTRDAQDWGSTGGEARGDDRSEESRVGKECDGTGSARRVPYT